MEVFWIVAGVVGFVAAVLGIYRFVWPLIGRLAFRRPTAQELQVERVEQVLRRVLREDREEREIVDITRRIMASSNTPQTQSTATTASLQDQILRRGTLVVAKFRAEPSRTWRDPSAQVQGLWQVHEKRTVLLKPPCIVAAPDGKEITTTHQPLCIPSFDVDVEWREATHVQGPLWGPLKRYVVKQFLTERQGKDFVCAVAYIGPEGQFHLNCPDYDQHLRDEWPYFKALEGALAINRLYRNEAVTNMTDDELREFVTENLVASSAIEDMVPERYRSALRDRPLETECVFLVLKGLIQRYKQAVMPPEASS